MIHAKPRIVNTGLTYGVRHEKIVARVIVSSPHRTLAVDTVSFRREKQELQVEGKVLVTAKDGGVMLLAPDGMLWNIEPQEIVDHTQNDQPFAPLSQAEAAKHASAGCRQASRYNTART